MPVPGNFFQKAFHIDRVTVSALLSLVGLVHELLLPLAALHLNVMCFKQITLI